MSCQEDPAPAAPAAGSGDPVPDTSPFAGVPAPLRRALEDRGFTRLTSVQRAALDAVEGARDLRISSQTGSGKTVAFGLVLAGRLLEDNRTDRRGPAALIVVPTRELAAQVREELGWLFAAVPGVQCDSVTGGTGVEQERRRLTRHPRVLVGTPGRLVDHIGSGALDCSDVEQLVLDEADQMLDMGFSEDLEAIVRAVPAQRRTHMLSATFPPAVLGLADGLQTDPVHVTGTELGQANADISHTVHVVGPKDRYGALVNLLLLGGAQRVLVFVATRAAATVLSDKLTGDGFAAMPLSGDLAQAQRTRTLNAFRNGTLDVLVATDVAARGLDVPHVALVIHGDLPMDGEVYVHRSGRTGRAGRKGRSVVLVSPNGARRARRILGDAGVDAAWEDAPGAAVVKKTLQKRARRRVRAAVEAADAPTPASVEFAASLLQDADPAEVLARVLGLIGSEAQCEPCELEVPPQPVFQPRLAQARGAQPRIPEQRSARGPGRERRRPAGDRGSAEGFTRFRVNWGFRDGANPRRLLAAVCRRGAVSSREIGAIDIDVASATFDVVTRAADEFERRVSRRDPRDPGQRIVRDDQGR